jgi:putative SOS response-associated peptidase YedK
VILRTAEEVDRWLTAEPPEALTMQQRLPDNSLQIVATGQKKDAPSELEPR